MFKPDLEKAAELEIKLPTSAGSLKKQKNSRQMSNCFSDYAIAFEYVVHNKMWKIIKQMGIPDHCTYLLPDKPVCRSRNNSLNQTWNNRLGQNW